MSSGAGVASRSFRRLWIASGISNLGDGVFGAAFPLLVASITRDPVLVAGATLAARLPWLLFGLISGALVDRMDRRKVMVVASMTRGIAVGLLGLAVGTGRGELVVIYAAAFALGVCETFFDTSAEAFVPRLVERDELPAANGRLQAVEFVGNSFVGPPIGAVLFAGVAAAPFVVDSASFLLAGVLILLIPGTYRSERRPEQGVVEDVVSGLRWLLRQRVLRTLTILAGVTNLVMFGITSTFVLFAQERLGVSDAGFGVLLAMLGLGGLVGAIAAPRLVLAFGAGTVVRITLALQIVIVLVFSRLTAPVPAGALMALFSAGIASWNVVAISLRQSLTPDEVRGRVAGAARTLAWGTQPVGALLGGVIAARFGLTAPYVLAGAGLSVALLATWRIVSNETIESARVA